MTRGGSTRRWRRTRHPILIRDRGLCQLRLPGCTLTATTIDHITPVSAGGTDDPANLRASCAPCNTRRGDDQSLAPPDPPARPATSWE